MSITSQMDADLTKVFLAGLAVAVTHINGALQETLNGFFDEAPEILLQDGAAVDSEIPTLVLLTAAAGNVDEGSSFLIGGVTYYVTHIEPDQHGTTRVQLNKDPRQ